MEGPSRRLSPGPGRMLSPRTHARRPGRVYPAGTMLRRETGQILPGLIMLMLAILALGMLTFRIGKAAVLRSGAQTAADAAALAGAAQRSATS